jgi:FkbM family methyltransferase
MSARTLLNKLPPAIQNTLRSLWHHVDLTVVPRRRLPAFVQVQHYRALLTERQIDCVIDVGANEGQFGEFMRNDVGYRGQIYSFEPVSQVFERLASKAAGDRQWHTIQGAMGDKHGTADINVAVSSVFSSLLEARNGLFNSLSQSTTRERITVYRLEDWFSGLRKFERILLKTDTQGSDLAVLRGAGTLFERIEAIQAELSFVPIYEGAPSWQLLVQEIEARGYAVSGMFPISMTHLMAVEFDCLAVRRHLAAPGEHCHYEDLMRRW